MKRKGAVGVLNGNWKYGDRLTREELAPVIPHLEKLCSRCGGHVFHQPDGGLACCDCRGSDYVEVMENEAADFRAELRRKLNEDAASNVNPDLNTQQITDLGEIEFNTPAWFDSIEEVEF